MTTDERIEARLAHREWLRSLIGGRTVPNEWFVSPEGVTGRAMRECFVVIDALTSDITALRARVAEISDQRDRFEQASRVANDEAGSALEENRKVCEERDRLREVCREVALSIEEHPTLTTDEPVARSAAARLREEAARTASEGTT